MRNEIDKDFYCSGGYFDTTDKYCLLGIESDRRISNCAVENCNCYHRKWPTPEQFKEEYGEEYPDDGAVYVFVGLNWHTSYYFLAKNAFHKNSIVCACTPFGRPDADWRPE